MEQKDDIMENITQKFWHMQNGAAVLKKTEKLYWDVDKKQVTELCLYIAVCMESRHQQHSKDIQKSQQCCPGSGVCSLKKINRNCWLAHCLEFH